MLRRHSLQSGQCNIVANFVAETLATKWTGNTVAHFLAETLATERTIVMHIEAKFAETLATKFTHNIVANL